MLIYSNSWVTTESYLYTRIYVYKLVKEQENNRGKKVKSGNSNHSTLVFLYSCLCVFSVITPRCRPTWASWRPIAKHHGSSWSCWRRMVTRRPREGAVMAALVAMGAMEAVLVTLGQYCAYSFHCFLNLQLFTHKKGHILKPYTYILQLPQKVARPNTNSQPWHVLQIKRTIIIWIINGL